MRGSAGRNVRIERIEVEAVRLLAIYLREEDELLGDPADDAPPLVAAPRHLRRRVFHEEIPDALLVPGVEPVPSVDRPRAGAKQAARVDPDAKEAAHRRKRLVALIWVIIVAICVPALVIALLLLG